MNERVNEVISKHPRNAFLLLLLKHEKLVGGTESVKTFVNFFRLQIDCLEDHKQNSSSGNDLERVRC